MKRYLLLLLACLTTSMSDAQQLSYSLDTLFEHQVSAEKPGIALLIWQSGKILYQKAKGKARLEGGEPLTPRTTFRMASVSKQFTAMGILLLEKEGKLKLEEPLSTFFPEFNKTVASKVTLKHLLTHTSGIADYEALMGTGWDRQILDEDVLKLVGTQNQTYFTPGTRFRYSNSGFCILAMVVQKVSGMPYAAFMREKLFIPLGMRRTYLYDEKHRPPGNAMGYSRDTTGAIIDSDQSLTSATRGDGCVYTCLEDYLVWHQALQQGKPLDIMKKLQEIHFKFPELPESGYGLGWFYSEANPTELFHSGTTCGFSNVVVRVPDKNLLIAYFSNLADNHELFQQVLNAMKGGAPTLQWQKLHKLTN
ncbi:MAG: serine hydrolase domain-containing protein [Siphonobacter sp.]